MKIITRCTHAFIEVESDQISETAYKSNPKEADEIIENLLSVIRDLSDYSSREYNEILKEQLF